VKLRQFSSRILLFILLARASAGILQSQSGSPGTSDPLGRTSPQTSILHFLEACHARDYSKAAYYLDLRKMPPADRAKAGPELAAQLEDLLDDTPFDMATLTRDPEGDQSDNLGANFEHLDTFHVDGQTLELQLERVELKAGLQVWLVSASSVAMIPTAHKAVDETAFEKALPQPLVTFEILDTPLWRWLALIAMAIALWYLSSAMAWVAVAAARSLISADPFRGPLRLALFTGSFRAAMELAPPSSLLRLFLERGLQVVFALALAWTGAVVIDLIGERWHARLDPRVAAVSYSVLPLGRQILKLTLYVVALLIVLRAWGYDTTTIVAGLGVGGLAIALAAQKTIENLFGGVSVISDRPVLVGDVCHFGDRTGTVMHIGLRSTRIRTPERTVVSVPNAQFASMTLENISRRDKIWFHPTLSLRRDTTSAQLAQVLQSCREILASRSEVEPGKIPVRLVGLGSYSFDIEINVYVTTSDYDEFLAVQQDLLMQLLQAVERAGTALAVPWSETVVGQALSPAEGSERSPERPPAT
jgi:MscS family membrane protein